MMTNDLINAQTAIDALIEWYGCEPNDLDAFKEILERMSSTQREKEKWTGDVAPIIHAHWEKADSRFHRRLVQCSNCGNFLDMEGVNCGRGSANYCPNCGAKMDADA